uniref:Uncharacterized protein n=1 Tax=Arundo donax TaxID=35708 RepID=A0A0A9CV99_ARUDO
MMSRVQQLFTGSASKSWSLFVYLLCICSFPKVLFV